MAQLSTEKKKYLLNGMARQESSGSLNAIMQLLNTKEHISKKMLDEAILVENHGTRTDKLITFKWILNKINRLTDGDPPRSICSIGKEFIKSYYSWLYVYIIINENEKTAAELITVGNKREKITWLKEQIKYFSK